MPRSLIMHRQICKKNGCRLPGVMSDSPGSHTLREINSVGQHTLGRLTHRGLIPWRVNLAGVCNPRESISLGYQTLGSHVLADFLLTCWGVIPQQVMLLYGIFGQNVIVLFTISFESNRIETCKFFKL